MSTVHVVPVNDLIDHLDEDCPCGPTVEAVFRDDGSNGWLVTHHSLDGREGREKCPHIATVTEPRPGAPGLQTTCVSCKARVNPIEESQ